MIPSLPSGAAEQAIARLAQVRARTEAPELSDLIMLAHESQVPTSAAVFNRSPSAAATFRDHVRLFITEEPEKHSEP